MNAVSRQHPAPPCLTSWFWSGDDMRSRNVSGIVLTGLVDMPAPPARLLADWDRELATNVLLETGDVETMPLARARARWPDYVRCVQAVSDWTAALGLPGILAASDVSLMACRGARYHHDGEQYGGAAFCNLFLSEDRGLDVHFPSLDLRIPLRRGTAMIFDTCQPHAVIPRGSSRFDPADFPPDHDFTQLFLTWELPVEDIGVSGMLNVAFDVEAAPPLPVDEEQVWADGARGVVCQHAGMWRKAD